MQRFWFQFSAWMGFAASLLGVALALAGSVSVQAQAGATDTPLPAGSAPFVTAQEEGANVRSGPSSVIYPVIGRLGVGETAPAIGVSPHHEWIEISFPGGARGSGWVYTAFVTLSPGFLPEVEPPPTPQQLATPTIDPTLAAAFNVEPTQTRLPTFTPPPPLTVPAFTNSGGASGGFPMGVAISIIALVGAAVLGISFFGRR
ncbi:MAG: SH3 domain-containing protein [Anaerolineales bacterium]